VLLVSMSSDSLLIAGTKPAILASLQTGTLQSSIGRITRQ
jgi:hypothetical protein